MTSRDLDELLDPTQAAAGIGISVPTLYRWMNRGELPYEQTPKGRMIRRRTVHEVRERRDAGASMDAAVERVLADAVESGALPWNPPRSSLLRVARILSEGAQP
jgi:excisionase family DNA binding protein